MRRAGSSGFSYALVALYEGPDGFTNLATVLSPFLPNPQNICKPPNEPPFGRLAICLSTRIGRENGNGIRSYWFLLCICYYAYACDLYQKKDMHAMEYIYIYRYMHAIMRIRIKRYACPTRRAQRKKAPAPRMRGGGVRVLAMRRLRYTKVRCDRQR